MIPVCALTVIPSIACYLTGQQKPTTLLSHTPPDTFLSAAVITMSRFTFLTALSLVLLSAVFASTSAFSLGSGTCHATADAVTRGTGKHPITPQLGFYLSGLPVQYAAGATYNFTITNTKKNPAITSAMHHHTCRTHYVP